MIFMRESISTGLAIVTINIFYYGEYAVIILCITLFQTSTGSFKIDLFDVTINVFPLPIRS